MLHPSHLFATLLLFLLLHVQSVHPTTTDTAASGDSSTVPEITSWTQSSTSDPFSAETRQSISPADSTPAVTNQNTASTDTVGLQSDATSVTTVHQTGGSTNTVVQQTDASTPSGLPNTASTDSVTTGTGTNPTVGGTDRTATGSIISSTSPTNNPSLTTSATSGATRTSGGPTATTGPVYPIRQNYSFVVSSIANLLTGVTNNTVVISSIQNMINSIFNMTQLIVTVIRVTIISRVRATGQNYTVHLDLDFQPRISSCDIQCVQNPTIDKTVNVNLQLPLGDGTTVTVPASSANFQKEEPETTTTTTTLPTTRRIGESPPGLAARLGMGLGISFLVVLLIGEIAFFIWRARSAKRSRSSHYATEIH